MNNLSHRFIVYFAFYPGYDIQVSKGSCFKTTIFKMFYLIEEFFQFRFQQSWRYTKRASQKAEHLFFHNSQVLHLRYKTIYRCYERFDDVIISEFIMRQQVQKP